MKSISSPSVPDLADDVTTLVEHATRTDRLLSTAAGGEPPIDREAWPGWIDRLPEQLIRLGAPPELLQRAQLLRMVNRRLLEIPSRAPLSGPAKQERWAQIERELIGQGIESVILFGGGQHTHWLLDSGWPQSDLLKVACVVDRQPTGEHIGAVPLISPEEAPPFITPQSVLLPSSDTLEELLLERALEHPELATIQTRRVYSAISPSTQAPGAHPPPTRSRTARPSSIKRCVPQDIDPAPMHRTDLGLRPQRMWIPSFCACSGWPDWATGYMNEHDLAFVWDLVEASARRATDGLVVAEIGTASGISTAVIAHGVHHLVGAPWSVHSFDLMTRCYFDPSHPVGAAIPELATDELMEAITLHTGQNARDAARSFQPASVGLAVIDGDHSRWAPTRDLLALLPALAPGAWVMLHDIELDEIYAGDSSAPGAQSGPQLLYHSWPGVKVRPHHADPALSNVGALQMPDDPLSARSILVDLLGAPA